MRIVDVSTEAVPAPGGRQELHRPLGTCRACASQLPELDVALYALYQQRIYRLLARDEQSWATLARLPRGLARFSRDLLIAHRELYRLTPPIAAHTIKVGSARPAGVLLRYYREAERRFHVSWSILAAVNFVESGSER